MTAVPRDQTTQALDTTSVIAGQQQRQYTNQMAHNNGNSSTAITWQYSNKRLGTQNKPGQSCTYSCIANALQVYCTCVSTWLSQEIGGGMCHGCPQCAAAGSSRHNWPPTNKKVVVGAHAAAQKQMQKVQI